LSEWSLIASFPRFLSLLSLFCFLALHPAVSAVSHELNVQFWAAFAYQIWISSATTSSRNSWAALSGSRSFSLVGFLSVPSLDFLQMKIPSFSLLAYNFFIDPSYPGQDSWI
jgi:hypothetical protein